MNRILISTTKDASKALENYLDNYVKDVSGDTSYIQFNYDNWNNPHDVFTEDIMNHLFNVIKDFAFIRLGDNPQDIESHGDLETFNVKIQTRVKYGE